MSYLAIQKKPIDKENFTGLKKLSARDIFSLLLHHYQKSLSIPVHLQYKLLQHGTLLNSRR